MRHWTTWGGIAALAVMISGCVSIPPFEATLQEQGPLYRPAFGEADEALPVTSERRSGKYVLRLDMEPDKPKAADKIRMRFVVEDVSGPTRKPVPGAKIACTARMTRVAGHIHNLGIHKEHPEVSPGHYAMHPIVFGMGGRWDVVAQVQLTDGTEFFAVYPVKVEGPPWPQR